MRAEILIDPKMAPRGRRMLEAMIAAAPISAVVREKYVGDCDVLMTYGIGHPVRNQWWDQHRRRGGRCIGWDLGYWHRDAGSMRVTIDSHHPQQLIRTERPDRWNAAGIAIRSDDSVSGPIVLVGMGVKSLRMFGMTPLKWEMTAVHRLRERFPDREIVFRPKRDADPRLPRVRTVLGPIEEVLKGASLVVCRHSNVAVDACIAGVPVQCDDGAARALYRDNPFPTPARRLQFLHSIAWWQWLPEESHNAWKYLLQRLSD